jgi:hypothetical protein
VNRSGIFVEKKSLKGRVAAVGIACTWHPGHSAAARISPYLEAAFTGPQ